MEEDFCRYGSMKSGDGGVIQLILKKVERQAIVDEIDGQFKSREDVSYDE